jgi:acyl carrier protein
MGKDDDVTERIAPGTSPTAEQIERWIVAYLARELGVDAAGIPLDQTLTDLGMTSRQAVFLTGELEEFTGQPVDPAIAWEHPTIRKLAAYLASPEAPR